MNRISLSFQHAQKTETWRWYLKYKQGILMLKCCFKLCQEGKMKFIRIQQRKLRKNIELIYFQPGNVTHIKRPAKPSSWNRFPLDGTLEFERWQLCNKSIETWEIILFPDWLFLLLKHLLRGRWAYLTYSVHGMMRHSSPVQKTWI